MEISTLQRQIKEIETACAAALSQKAQLEQQLQQLQSQCKHDWEVTYTPIIKPAREELDFIGEFLGLSHMASPLYIPERKIPQWTRTCRSCAKREVTSRSAEKVTHVPQF